ncbi:hypothetical protein ACOZ4I_15570 [Haloarcula salina]|uniref:hypothetical protein n=1 Tax=Haloarcula salina TaxID=1429914 RepID=UPI003C701539
MAYRGSRFTVALMALLDGVAVGLPVAVFVGVVLAGDSGWAAVEPTAVAWLTAVPAGAATLYGGHRFYRDEIPLATLTTTLGLVAYLLANRHFR